MTRATAMTRQAVDQHCREMRRAIGETLRLARTDSGHCRLCAAEPGAQHSTLCALWPVISAKAAYALGADDELFDDDA